MRKRAIRGFAAKYVIVDELAPKCHKPFVPTKPGGYLLQRCPRCGEAVPVGEKVEGDPLVFRMEVTSPFQKSPKEKE